MDQQTLADLIRIRDKLSARIEKIEANNRSAKEWCDYIKADIGSMEYAKANMEKALLKGDDDAYAKAQSLFYFSQQTYNVDDVCTLQDYRRGLNVIIQGALHK